MRGKLLHGCSGFTGCTGYFGVGRAVPSEPQNGRNTHAPARGSPGTARPTRRHAALDMIPGSPWTARPTRRHAALDMIPGSPGTARPTRRHAALDMIPGSPGTARPTRLPREIQRAGFYRRRWRESKRAGTRSRRGSIRVPPTQHAPPAPPPVASRLRAFSVKRSSPRGGRRGAGPPGRPAQNCGSRSRRVPRHRGAQAAAGVVRGRMTGERHAGTRRPPSTAGCSCKARGDRGLQGEGDTRSARSSQVRFCDRGDDE